MTIESLQADDMKMDLGAMLGAVWSCRLRIIVVTALALVATYGVLMFVPKMYESVSSVLVEPRANAYTRPGGDIGSNVPTGDETAISSQIEMIKSRDTLLAVIEAENLREIPELSEGSSGLIGSLLGRKPDPADLDAITFRNLSDRLTVTRERDSRIISISVRTESPELSSRIANALANIHVTRRAGQSLSDTAEASVWLEEQIEKLRIRVAEAENKVASFRIDNDLFTSGANNTSLLDQQLSNIATQITSAQERKNAAQSKATLIRGLLDQGQPIEGVPDVRESVVVQQLSEQKAQLQGERAQKMATLLSNHPNVRALTAQIGEIDNQIKLEGRRVAAALEAEAKIEADLEASLKADLERMKSGVSTATKESVTLNELEREAKAQRDLLESYLLRYRDAVSRTDVNSALPDVRVVSYAAPSVSPASPKTTLILIAVLIIALFLQVGSILFSELMSGRALVARYAPPAEPVPQADTAAPEPQQEPEPQIASYAEPSTALDEIPPAESTLLETSVEPAFAEPEPEYAYLPELDEDPQPASPYNPEMDRLSQAIALGEARVVVVSALGDSSAAATFADDLIADAMHKGLSVVRVDAGSERNSVEPGITDLSMEQASFGDVVHPTAIDGLAEVPWGQQQSLDRRSARPFTLVEALSDIYELVIVLTGKFGIASALPVFAGLDCRLVLTLDQDGSERATDAALVDAEALGFANVQVIALPFADAEVA